MAATVRSKANRVMGLFKKTDKDISRDKLRKELFNFQTTVRHGFPSKPSAVAYDPTLGLLAVGSKTGELRVLGQPGVEFIGTHSEPIRQLLFVPHQGRVITLSDPQSNSLHLWEINTSSDGSESSIEVVKSYKVVNDNKLNGVSVCAISLDGNRCYLGTDSGNVFVLDVGTFELLDSVIYQNVAMQNVPDDYKVNPGSVEAIAVHPCDPNRVLIGYNRGLVVLFDIEKTSADSTFVSPSQQGLEALAWFGNGERFSVAHSDGSLIQWNAVSPAAPQTGPAIPYGPFPCKRIERLAIGSGMDGDYTVFSGGMPRASYGDRHCVTVMQGSRHVVFELTSKIVDFIAFGDRNALVVSTLVILAEEEIIFIDLSSEGWPVFRKPYLNSLHFSSITCSAHYSDVDEGVWSDIAASGAEAFSVGASGSAWPVAGGKELLLGGKKERRDLLVTGHENGSLCFWDAGYSSLRLLYKAETVSLFVTDADSAGTGAVEADEDWPPFRKVGEFDPYTDDPRLAVQKVALSGGRLVVGGSAGQLVVYGMVRESRLVAVPVVAVRIVPEGFVWKGHGALAPRDGALNAAPGFQPALLVQCEPPGSVTAVALGGGAGEVVAVGTGHGFAVVDVQRAAVLGAPVSTLPPAGSGDVADGGDGGMNRRKTLKQSLRESFRRLRKKRSSASKSPTKQEGQTSEASKSEEGKAEISPVKVEPHEEDHPRVHRLVETRKEDSSLSSMVRVLYFVETYVRDGLTRSRTLWVGTHGGQVLVHLIPSVVEDSSRTELAKELRLKHRAPVVALLAVDRDGRPVRGEERSSADNKHLLVVVTEEQLKLFLLPSLKPLRKFRLTAVDGSRVRKIGFAKYVSSVDPTYSEDCISCLNNLGELAVYSLASLRPQLKVDGIPKDNVVGINSCVFTDAGEGFYLRSTGEFLRFTLSAGSVTKPVCVVELAEGMRPKPVVAIREEESGKSEGDKPVEDKPEGDKPAGDKPAGDKQEGDKPERDESTEIPEETNSRTDDDKAQSRGENVHEKIARMKEEFFASGSGDDDVITSAVVVTHRSVETTQTSRLVTSDGDETVESKTETVVSKSVEKSGDDMETAAMLSEMEEAFGKSGINEEDDDDVMGELEEEGRGYDKMDTTGDITVDDVKDHLAAGLAAGEDYDEDGLEIEEIKLRIAKENGGGAKQPVVAVVDE